MQASETKIYGSTGLLFEKIQKAEEKYSALLAAAGGGGNVLLTKHGIRAMRGSKKEKQNKTRRKKPPLSRSSTLIRFSCEVPFLDVYAYFLLPPSPASSSVFFVSSLVCTDQNPVNASEPIERRLGGCHGDPVGGACASRAVNLLRFDIGGAII